MLGTKKLTYIGLSVLFHITTHVPIHPANKIAETVSNKPVDKPTDFMHSPSFFVLTGIMCVNELVDRCIEQVVLIDVVFTSSQRAGSEQVIF